MMTFYADQSQASMLPSSVVPLWGTASTEWLRRRTIAEARTRLRSVLMYNK